MEAEQPENSSICTPQSEVLVRDNKTLILEEIMKDLTQPNMIIFGVYGSCMSNKINLVAQIKKRVESDSLFDAVVSVSQITRPDSEEIQGRLGYLLDLDLYDIDSVEERGRCLCEKIKSKEKILIIIVLNDVKGGIDLAEIGIPFGKDHVGSKILFISETRELLSDQMKTQKEYSVDNDPEELDIDSYDCVPLFLQQLDCHEEPAIVASTMKEENKRLGRKRKSPDVTSIQEELAMGDDKTSLEEIAEIHWVYVKSHLCSARDNSDSIGIYSMQYYEVVMERLDEIEKAVKQPNMRIVGVYGSKDGREFVAEQIGKRLVRDGVCDVVVHVMASAMKKSKWLCGQSKSPDLKRIQEELGNKLGVQLVDKTSLKKRASCLCDTINTKGNVLIILDDLQARINLAELGIPFGNDHLPSKIMLLAHSSEVLSNQMIAPQTLFSVDS